MLPNTPRAADKAGYRLGRHGLGPWIGKRSRAEPAGPGRWSSVAGGKQFNESARCPGSGLRSVPLELEPSMKAWTQNRADSEPRPTLASVAGAGLAAAAPAAPGPRPRAPHLRRVQGPRGYTTRPPRPTGRVRWGERRRLTPTA